MGEGEPKLKYERLSPDLKNILQKDNATAMAVHQVGSREERGLIG